MIRDLETHIRELINEPRPHFILMQDLSCWFQLCTCLDVIGDTALAVDAYLDGGISASQRKYAMGAEYLIVYGLLQVLVVQQDAVTHLHEALASALGSRINVSFDVKDHLALDNIRDIRNNSIGHPTKRDRRKNRSVSFHAISRPTLHRGGFDMLSSDGHEPSSFTKISIYQLIEDQQAILSDALRQLADELRRWDEEHRMAFQDEKLVDLFPGTLGYAFEKLGQRIRSDDPVNFGLAGFEVIQRTLADLRDALERRGSSIKTYPGIEDAYEELEYPIRQMDLYLEGEPSDIVTPALAEIVVFFIQKKVDELKRMAREIDEDYASGDESV
jgi:hypothetical protein